MNRILPALLMFVSIAPAASAVLQDNVGSYLREDGVLWKLDRGRRFQVDPHVISVRLGPEVVDARAAIDGASAEVGVPGELRILRSNRLGIHDLELPLGGQPRDQLIHPDFQACTISPRDPRHADPHRPTGKIDQLVPHHLQQTVTLLLAQRFLFEDRVELQLVDRSG